MFQWKRLRKWEYQLGQAILQGRSRPTWQDLPAEPQQFMPVCRAPELCALLPGSACLQRKGPSAIEEGDSGGLGYNSPAMNVCISDGAGDGNSVVQHPKWPFILRQGGETLCRGPAFLGLGHRLHLGM